MHTLIYMNVCMSLSMSVYAYVFMHVCMHVYMYVCLGTQLHASAQSLMTHAHTHRGANSILRLGIRVLD